MRATRNQKRQGAMGPFTALLLIPLVAMVAFAVDMSFIWRTEAELQNSADSAALAGAAQLANALYVSGLGDNSAGDKSVLLADASANAKYWAKYYGDKHLAGFEGVNVVVDDVKLYYIANPDDPSSPMETPTVDKFPNAVEVTTRRDDTYSENNNPLSLYFARVLGLHEVNVRTTGIAAIKPISVIGFAGNNRGILPIVMHRRIFEWLSGSANQKPQNVKNDDGDYFDVGTTTNEDGNYTVTMGADGTREATIYGYKKKPNEEFDDTYASGNWGLMDLANGVNGAPGNEQVSSWIKDGVQNGEFESWPNGFKATKSNPLTVNVQPGYQNTLQNDLQAIIGEPRMMPIYEEVIGGGGQTSGYVVVGFAAMVVVDVNLQGNSGRSYMRVQLTSFTPSEEVILNDGIQQTYSDFTYKVVLIR